MKIGDAVIIVSTIVISLVIAYFTTFHGVSSDTFSFMIKHENKNVLQLEVGKDYQGIYAFEFDDHVGYVEVDQGRVRVMPMSKEVCPRQICSRLGWADRQGDILVCLPNKLVVEVIDKKGESDYGADALSF